MVQLVPRKKDPLRRQAWLAAGEEERTWPQPSSLNSQPIVVWATRPLILRMRASRYAMAAAISPMALRFGSNDTNLGTDADHLNGGRLEGEKERRLKL
jgi:hypothetical protein